MEKIELLEYKIRKYNKEKDMALPTFSYSKLDMSDKCSMEYDLKYNQKNYPPQASIPLDIGTICHKILELKSRMIMNKEEINYDYLKKVLTTGIVENTEKGTENIIGTKDIKQKFGFEAWFEQDNASTMNYDEKIGKFIKEVIPTRLEEDDWKPFGAELDFDFVYNYGTEENPKEVHIHGFIDSVMVDDIDNPTKFKVIDYKTSKKVYPDTQLKTSLQQSIYGLAIYCDYSILPEEYEYDFILINKKTDANSKGYLARALKKLDKLFNAIDAQTESGVWKPKPTPLCHWCSFCETNKDTVEPYKSMCPYYSLWTPDKKVFDVNKAWKETDSQVDTESKPKRKLIF